MMMLYNKYKKQILYIIFGGLTVLITFISYLILVNTILSTEDPLQLQIANIISWIIAVIFAFITNRKIVFKSRNQEVLKEFLKFILLRIFTLFLDMLIMYLGVSLLKFNDSIVKIISQTLVVISNYIFSKKIIFK